MRYINTVNNVNNNNCCVLIGKGEIDISFPTEEERFVSVEYMFGNTEISMNATEDLHGPKCEATYQLIWTMKASNRVTVIAF